MAPPFEKLVSDALLEDLMITIISISSQQYLNVIATTRVEGLKSGPSRD
jgi:energy-converting hydrogenase Eha subunit C